MSFGFGVGDFLAVIKLVKKIRTDFADAPKQFEHISTEVRSLSIVLQDIEIFVSSDHVSDTQKQELNMILAGCERTLRDTENTLDKYCDIGNKSKSIGQAARRAWKRLTLEPDDIRELRSRISSNVTLLNSLVGGVTRDNVAKVVKRQDRQEHQEILDWLTPIDYAAQQSDFINRRQAGTGQWLLDSAEYQQWIATAKESLFCPGIPGAGKTILASIVVNDLLERFPPNSSTAICYIYCNFRRTEEQKLDDLLSSLLRQLAQGQATFPRSIMDLYKRHKDRRTRPSVEEICTALHSVTASYSRVFVAVDALDECDISNGCRPRFISELLHLQAQLGANLLATSRFIPEITESFSQSANKEIRATVEDIGRYLEGCMISLPRFVSTNIDLQETIKEKIIDAADGMFLLAKLHLDSLKGKRSPKAVRSALDRFATGSDAYDAAYTDAINRIKSQLPDQKQLAFQTLSWIACAKRPLKTVELQHALGTEPNMSAFDEENVPDIQDVVSNCCGLITVDEQTGIIRLVHYTAQEYFERTQNIWFPNGQIYLTEICVSYLSFDVFKAGRCESVQDFENRLSTYQLYNYASHYWGAHARSATTYQWSSTFLGTQSQVDAAAQGLLAGRRWEHHTYRLDIPIQMTGLHLVAFFGLEQATRFFSHLYDHDGNDSDNRTPLSYAAENGHEAMVRLLLEQKAEVDAKSKYSQTPLLLAASNGHEAVVQLLLEQKAEVDAKDKYGQTPLLLASENGHEAVVRLLLGQKAEVDAKATGTFNAGPTPLSFAASNGHEAVVRLLLEQKAEVDAKEEDGRTPLWFAAKNGYEAVVRLLLGQKAEVDTKDEDGRTPLYFAARNRHESVVRLLLEQKAEVDAKDKYGQTPLLLAASNGHEAVVQLLLEQKAEVDAKDKYGQTPLLLASENGHDALVRLLLESEAEVDSRSQRGRTPLSYAAAGGHEATVRLLLGSKAEADSKGRSSRTPLSYAAAGGYEATVRLLLESKVGVDSEAKNSRTPLSFAAENGHDALVRLLLESEAEVNSRSQRGRTPLSYAAAGGHEATVRLLLGSKAEAGSKDQSGLTPLAWAAYNGCTGIVNLLLCEPTISLDSVDYYGRTPLHWALWNGHKDVEATFLSKGASEPVDLYGIWTMFSNLEGGMVST